MSQESGRRRFFAEEIQPIANLQSAGLVEALATVPRQQFLPPGPWLIRSESDFGGPSRQTPDGDPRHVYHNLSNGGWPDGEYWTASVRRYPSAIRIAACLISSIRSRCAV